MDSDESYANSSFVSDDEERPSAVELSVPSVGFSEAKAVKPNEPVRLVSIKPLVEHRGNETDRSSAVVGEMPRRAGRDLSKYNWKHFLPITRRDPSKPAIDEAGFLSLMFMSWATPVITKSFKRALQLEDFDKLSPYESAEVNFKRVTRLWNEEVEKQGLHDASMPRVLWRAIRTRIFFGMVFFVLSQLISFLGPAVIVRRILEYVEEKDSASKIEGVGWVIGLFLAEVTRSLLLSMSFFINVRTGSRARAMVLMMVYNKVTKLRNVGDKSIGEPPLRDLFPHSNTSRLTFVTPWAKSD